MVGDRLLRLPEAAGVQQVVLEVLAHFGRVHNRADAVGSKVTMAAFVLTRPGASACRTGVIVCYGLRWPPFDGYC